MEELVKWIQRAHLVSEHGPGMVFLDCGSGMGGDKGCGGLFVKTVYEPYSDKHSQGSGRLTLI